MPSMLESARPVVFRIVRPWSAPCRRVGAPDPARLAVQGISRTCVAQDTLGFGVRAFILLPRRSSIFCAAPLGHIIVVRAYPPSRNETVIVVSTSTGSPFSKVGL
jgi:hypothetical protein